MLMYHYAMLCISNYVISLFRGDQTGRSRQGYENIPAQFLWQVFADADAPLPPEAASLSLDFETDEWVYFLIINNFTHGFESSSAYHLMHLHGHDMAILAQGPGPVPDDVVLNLEDPPRRDTVMVEHSGG